MAVGQFEVPKPQKLIVAMQRLANKQPATAINRLTPSTTQTYIGTWVAAEGADANLSQVILQGGALVRFVPKSTSQTFVAGDVVKLQKSGAMMIHIVGKMVGDFTLAGAGSNVTPPGAPSGLHTTAVGSTTVTLAWTAGTDHFGSGLRYNIFLNGNFKASTGVGALSLGLTGLKAGTNYSAYVTATDGAGNASNQSNTVSFTTSGTPVNPPGTTVTTTYKATALRSYSYNGHDEIDHWHDNACYQGSDQSGGYQQHSIMLFNWTQIHSDLAGTDSVQAKISMTYAHWWYHSGGTAVVGTHDYTNAPTTISPSHYNSSRWRAASTAGKRLTVTMGAGVVDEFRSGTTKGIHIGRGDNFDPQFYGYTYGTGSNVPVLSLTYTT